MAYVIAGRHADAIPVIDSFLTRRPADQDPAVAAIVAHYEAVRGGMVAVEGRRRQAEEYGAAYKGRARADRTSISRRSRRSDLEAVPHGCNYPWSTDGATVFYGLDFGANVWGSHLGVSTRRAAVRRDFDEMAGLGFTCGALVRVRRRPRRHRLRRPRPARRPRSAPLHRSRRGARDCRGAGIALVLVLLDHRGCSSGVRETIADPVTGGAARGAAAATAGRACCAPRPAATRCSTRDRAARPPLRPPRRTRRSRRRTSSPSS